ncbi:MAG: hypothetical protein JRG91_07265 [Deltaproteobacteria bacterium]|nr:hypothetical protein [Deltaproteobacteria bacterium]
MFFMTDSANPFDYMSGLWSLLIVLLVLCGLLLLIGRPLHRFYTDRKTRQIIKEAGVDDEPAPSPGADEGGRDDGPDDEEAGSEEE